MNSGTYTPPGHIVCGTCSICGGAVTAPEVWHCVIPATPTCSSCGAVAAQHGAIIPMIPSSPTRCTGTESSSAICHDCGMLIGSSGHFCTGKRYGVTASEWSKPFTETQP